MEEHAGSSNAVNTNVKGAEQEEESVTMVDILKAEEELEQESAAVLGGSDEKCCTYAKVKFAHL